MGCHWLIVGNAVEIVALDDVVYLIGHLYLAFFYNIVVADSVQYNIRGND
jgi:hypothetical protein